MAEEKAPSTIVAGSRQVITSIMGLLSGAVLMYVSPLVTNVIKPGKPFANFGQQESRPRRHLSKSLHRRDRRLVGFWRRHPTGALFADAGKHHASIQQAEHL